jgi:hypothetical protein
MRISTWDRAPLTNFTSGCHFPDTYSVLFCRKVKWRLFIMNGNHPTLPLFRVLLLSQPFFLLANSCFSFFSPPKPYTCLVISSDTPISFFTTLIEAKSSFKSLFHSITLLIVYVCSVHACCARLSLP